MKYAQILLFLIFVLPFTGQPLFAQKRPLRQEDCKRWQVIREPRMSSDGRWVAYRYDHLYDTSDTLPALYLYDTRRDDTRVLFRVSDFQYFNGGKWVKIVRRGIPDSTGMSVDSTFFMRLADGKSIYWDKAGFPFVDETPVVVSLDYVNDSTGSYSNLTLWDIDKDRRMLISRVGSYTLLDQRRTVLYEHKGADETTLCLRYSNGREDVLFRCPVGCLGGYSFDPGTGEGTLVVAADTGRASDPSLLYTFSLTPGSARLVTDLAAIEGLPEGTRAARRPYTLINGGKDIMLELEPSQHSVPTPPRQKPERGFELELWNWDAPASPWLQRPSRGGFNPMDYPKYVYHADTRRLVVLSDGQVDGYIIPTSNQYHYIFTQDGRPYTQEFDWHLEQCYDYDLVRLSDGHRTRVITHASNAPQWSPDGRYAVWFDEVRATWCGVDLVTGKLRDISSDIPYPLADELHDMPFPASDYGIAAWLEDGNSLAVYDRYDIWVIDLTGKNSAYCLTRQYGRQHGIELRLRNQAITGKDLLAGFNTRDKSQGVYILDERGRVDPLATGPYNLRVEAVSGDGRSILWTRSSFEQYPDLLWSDNRFSRSRRVTDSNPQQAEYFWGTARLERWSTPDGRTNEGILFLPEGYEPGRSYPLIVTFYERNTDGLYSYRTPELPSSVIDIPTYVSNGYIVFMPDVHYRLGYPAESCYDEVMSGVRHLIATDVADSTRIGLIGHSWGGYQVADLVTRTNLFRCASPGASVVNVVSSYTGLRGGRRPRMYVYEDGQGRLGCSLWEDPEMYIRESPIFRADSIRTPLLIFHCDGDNAVPFSQGMDLFLAMRRLHRPAWLLNYKGEGHSLGTPEAMTDWGIRMRQFFDHYLKGVPMPRWMREGITVSEQGYDLKYE